MVILISIATPVCISSGWTPVSQEEKEYNRLSPHCAQIMEQCTAMGASRSSALGCTIFTYLKEVGTPIAFCVLQEQVKMGRVPASYLLELGRPKGIGAFANTLYLFR